MNTGDRVRTAAEATAAAVREIRPLALPERSAVSAESRREHGGRSGFRGSETLMKIKDIWLIPLGAAALFVMLAVALVTLHGVEGYQGPAPAGSAPAPISSAARAAAIAAIPEYYAIAYRGIAGHDGSDVMDVVVGDSHTGKTIATVAAPGSLVTAGNDSTAGVSATADDRSFVVSARDLDGDTGYFLVRIAPGTKQAATVEKLPIPLIDPGNLLGFAVSPDGTQLAALSVRGNGTTLRVYSTKTGATLRTWVAPTWRSQGNGLVTSGVSWTADGRQVAFSTVVSTSKSPFVTPLQERVIGATAPDGDLATASRVVLKAPGNCGSLLLTPDGGTVVCATQITASYIYAPSGAILATKPTDCGKDGPRFVAYSAATGKLLRVLDQYAGACDQGTDTVLWSDDSARHVVGEQSVHQGDQHYDRYGVAGAGRFVKFQVTPPLSQWYSYPGF